MSTPFLICAAVTLVSALVSCGFSLAALVSAQRPTQTLALYTCARSVALAVAAVGPFLTGSLLWLEATALSMVIVQALDACIGLRIRDLTKTAGPAATAFVNLAALTWLLHR